MRYPQKTNTKKYLLALLVFVLLASGVYAYQYQETGNNNTVPVSDPNFSDGTEREVFESPVRDGGVIETPEGDTDQPIDSSDSENWAVSEEGDITLIEPRENALFTSGSKISGLANVDRVHYRLIDDRVGVVATGSIGVVDGRFSGIFEFDSQGTEGRLDIFSTLDNGAEINIIETPIRLR